MDTLQPEKIVGRFSTFMKRNTPDLRCTPEVPMNAENFRVSFYS